MENYRWTRLGLHCKVNPDESVAHLKARLVAQEYSQTYKISHNWILHYLDEKNIFFMVFAFLHVDMEKEVYIDQPPEFIS